MDLDECVLITDATLIHLAMGCPRIEYLVGLLFDRVTWLVIERFQTLSHCELITDEGIRHLSMSPCAAENLTVLELDNCPLVTDTSLEHLTSCHNLQRVELYDCQLITRVGIKRLRVNDYCNNVFYECTLNDVPEPFAQHQSPRLLRAGDAATNRERNPSAILSLLCDTLRASPLARLPAALEGGHRWHHQSHACSFSS